MLLKFFSNSHSSANLSKAGYLTASTQGRTIAYRANTKHLLYQELKKLVHKYLGFETIIESVVNKVVDRLGLVDSVFIMGDYAQGKDSGIIDLVLVGAIDQQFLQTCIQKAEGLIKRRIRSLVLSPSEFELNKHNLKPETAIWLWGEQPAVA
jgi:hypothetical protein